MRDFGSAILLALAVGACGRHAISGDAGAPDAGAPGDAGCHVDAGPLDPTTVALGWTLIKQYDCQKCHGSALTGNFDGVQSPGIDGGFAYPPNLTPDDDTGLGCWDRGEVVRAVLFGIDDQGQPLCPPMPQFADAGLDAGGAAAIAEFLESLPAERFLVPSTPACSGAAPDPDAGAVDAGDMDAGAPWDAGAMDAGALDSGVSLDAGPVDAGSPDAGDDFDAGAADGG